MLHNLEFDLGKHLICCSMEINLSLDVIDEQECVIWDGATSLMTVDTLERNIQISPRAQRKDNFLRIQQTIEEAVAEMTLADYNEIKYNNEEG